MTRRSFFAALAAPVVAPMVPKAKVPDSWAFVTYSGANETWSVSTTGPMTVTLPVMTRPHDMESDARDLIDIINKEVQRGNCRLTATDVKR